MKTILLRDMDSNPALLKEVVEVLEKGGLVCHPAPTGYKLVADLGSPEAITAMLQAKRRIGHAPALVFLPDARWAEKVAETVKGIQGAWINETKVVTDGDGNITEWRVNLRVTFLVQ